jgi:putative ATP-binding cassette transporter
VFLDEATAALDEDNQQVAMSIFDRELPHAAVVSIGHRPGLEAFHTRTLELVPSPSGARLRLKPRALGRGEPPRRATGSSPAARAAAARAAGGLGTVPPP